VAAVWAVSVWADDALKGVVDPYDAPDQRAKFFKVAGSGNELDKEKFLADQKAGGHLIAPFEKWETAALFDKNKNGTLDWFEFEAYRQAMRAAVMAEFDKDKNGKLADAERVDALKALTDGKVTIKPAPEAARALPPGFMGMAGGPGGEATSQPTSQPGRVRRDMTPEERQAMMEERQRQMEEWRKRHEEEMLKRFDKNGDGVLDDEERAIMAATLKQEQRDMMMEHMPAPMKEFTLRNFNADGSGKLSEEDWKAFEEFGRESQQMFQGLQTLAFDKDATEAERRAAMLKWAPVGMKIQQNMNKRAEEAGGHQALGEKMMAGVSRYMERFEKQAVADHGGKPSAASRTAMLKLIDADIRERAKKVSTSGSGKLEPAEGEKLFMEMMDEFLKE